jgi:hypothetical protein
MSVIGTLTLMILLQTGIISAGISISPVVALFIVCVFALMAYALNFKRLAVYGMLYGGSEIIWGIFYIPWGPIAFLVAGGGVLAYGSLLLIRFIRQYPLSGEELHHALDG